MIKFEKQAFFLCLQSKRALTPFAVDKLNRLEKIGAIASAEQWLMLREMRNAFSHEYPDDPDIQAAILNKAFSLAGELLATLREVEVFANRYV